MESRVRSEPALSVPAARLWDGYFHAAPHGMALFRAVRSEAGRLDDFMWCGLNDSAASALGVQASDVVGRSARAVRAGAFDPRVFRRLVTAQVTRRVQEFEQVLDRANVPAEDGGARDPRDNLTWYAVTVIPVDDDYLVVQFRSITHYKSVLHQAVELLNRDDLTGLANRRHLKTRFWVLRRRGVQMALLYFDLNGFKAVNDTYGHEVGDQVLSIIGQRLTAKVRPDEMVARLGGDEFAVLLAGGDLTAVDSVTGRLIEAVEEPIHLESGAVRLSASVGAALYPDDAESFEALVSRADARMYEQKRRRTHH